MQASLLPAATLPPWATSTAGPAAGSWVSWAGTCLPRCHPSPARGRGQEGRERPAAEATCGPVPVAAGRQVSSSPHLVPPLYVRDLPDIFSWYPNSVATGAGGGALYSAVPGGGGGGGGGLTGSHGSGDFSIEDDDGGHVGGAPARSGGGHRGLPAVGRGGPWGHTSAAVRSPLPAVGDGVVNV